MATKFGEDEDVEVELELCLSLGGPFKKTKKTKPVEICMDEQSNAVIFARENDVSIDGGASKHEINATMRKETRKKREAKLLERSGEEGECKRIRRTECNEVTDGVNLKLSFIKIGNGFGSGQFRENGKAGSPVSSSSDVSNPSSSSRHEGGNFDSGVNSGETKLVNNIETGTEEIVQSRDSSKDAVEIVTQEWSNFVVKETIKPQKPVSNGNRGSLPFAQMPCVTSTGNGPAGKTVNGFLYRYSKSEISIICVCHGTSFSPAEFIIHAGGTHVSHPLRHITVFPSTF